MITIVPYETSWPEAFIAIARPLRTALGGLALRIDHIGSTSVPGLAAKDVIDVQVTLKDFSYTSQLVTALGSLGYTLIPHITSDHLPPLSQGSGAHPVASAAYAQIKTSLSKLHPDDVDFYYAIKDRLCDIVIDAAEDWARTTGWHMGPVDS